MNRGAILVFEHKCIQMMEQFRSPGWGNEESRRFADWLAIQGVDDWSKHILLQTQIESGDRIAVPGTIPAGAAHLALTHSHLDWLRCVAAASSHFACRHGIPQALVISTSKYANLPSDMRARLSSVPEPFFFVDQPLSAVAMLEQGSREGCFDSFGLGFSHYVVHDASLASLVATYSCMKNICSLAIHECNLTAEALGCRLLRQNPKLTRVSLSSWAGGVVSERQLDYLLSDHACVFSSLLMADTQFCHQAIRRLLKYPATAGVAFISLVGCKLTTRDLASVLTTAGSQMIQHLDVSNNHLDDDCANQLRHISLGRLEQLSIHCNWLSIRGVIQLLHFAVAAHLRRISLSNVSPGHYASEMSLLVSQLESSGAHVAFI